MIRRILAGLFAVAFVALLSVTVGTPTAASADGERTTISPWRGEEHVFRTIEGSGFAPNHPITLQVTDPALTPWRHIDPQGLMTGPDGSIWFQIMPAGSFASGRLTNGIWQLRVCANACQDLSMFIGGDPVIPAGLPAKICTPRITPFYNYPTFGPPGEAIDPATGLTYNQIVAYCGPYATPWIAVEPLSFLVPVDWYPGVELPYTWPYAPVFPWGYWDPLLYTNQPFPMDGYPNFFLPQFIP